MIVTPPDLCAHSHSAWNFGSGPDDFYAATSFSSLYLEPVTSPLAK